MQKYLHYKCIVCTHDKNDLCLLTIPYIETGALYAIPSLCPYKRIDAKWEKI